MRFALILITMALMAVVGFSWVPAEQANSTPLAPSIEDNIPAPDYNSIPVEYLEFDPLEINVQYVSADSLTDSRIY